MELLKSARNEQLAAKLFYLWFLNQIICLNNLREKKFYSGFTCSFASETILIFVFSFLDKKVKLIYTCNRYNAAVMFFLMKGNNSQFSFYISLNWVISHFKVQFVTKWGITHEHWLSYFWKMILFFSADTDSS